MIEIVSIIKRPPPPLTDTLRHEMGDVIHFMGNECSE